MKKTYLLTLALFASTSVFAETEEHREHGAHEHGHAQLSVIAEKEELLLSIETPAMNVFGFEHEPKTEAQKEVVHEAVETLEDFSSLILLDLSAKCSVKKTEITQPFTKGHDEHAEHKDEHKHDEHEHEEEHAEHKDEHKHDEHDHEEHEESVHSDVDLEVSIHCEDASELTTIDLTPFFKRFPLFLELETQAITNGQQSALVLSKDNPVFSFKK